MRLSNCYQWIQPGKINIYLYMTYVKFPLKKLRWNRNLPAHDLLNQNHRTYEQKRYKTWYKMRYKKWYKKWYKTRYKIYVEYILKPTKLLYRILYCFLYWFLYYLDKFELLSHIHIYTNIYKYIQIYTNMNNGVWIKSIILNGVIPNILSQ